MLFFAITVAQGSGEDLVAAQQCYKLSNVHPPTSYEVRGSLLTAPTLAFLPRCWRTVVHEAYCSPLLFTRATVALLLLLTITTLFRS